MLSTKRANMALAVLGLSAFSLLMGAQSGDTYKLRFSPVPADARTRAELAGTGSVTAALSGSKLSINGSFQGLLSPATKAELHSAVAAGVRGPVVRDLKVDKGESGTISDTVDLTPQQIESFHKGGLYIQLYSEKQAAEGVLWGWFLK